MMTRQRSALILIIVPAVVSLAVTLLILNLFGRMRGTEPTTLILPTYSSTSQIPPRATRPVTQEASGDGSAGDQGGETGSVDDGEPGGDQGGSANATDEVPAGDDGGEGNPDGCDNPVHTVASGEVLGTIAETYGVSIDEIIELNQSIDPTFDPDFLSVGQELVIPVCGIPTPTPTGIPSETAIPTRNVPTPIATPTSPPAGTILVTISRVLDPGDITREAVEIVNAGSPVDLAEWVLTGEGLDEEFIFPSFRLFSDGAVTVYTGVGQNTPIDLFWGLDHALWDVGDVIQLFDDDGDLQAEYEITDEEE